MAEVLEFFISPKPLMSDVKYTAKPKPCHKPATVPTRLLGGKGHTENKARPSNTLLLAGVGLGL